MKREESRQQALIFLFENEFSPNTPEEILEMAELLRGEKVSGFSKELFLGTLENLSEIDAVIEKNLKGWKKERLSKVVLSILRLGTFELIYQKTPVNIVIDQAVKISQKYATQSDAVYINGVLGAVGREHCENKSEEK